MEERIKAIEEKISIHISNHKELSQQVSSIESIPGCGRTTAIGVIALLPNLEHYCNARSLAAHVGVTPMNYSSGSSVRKKTRMSKIDCPDLRRVLYFPAIVAKNHNPILKLFAERLISRGKSKMVVIGAIMRKPIHIIFGILKSGKRFNENILKITI